MKYNKTLTTLAAAAGLLAAAGTASAAAIIYEGFDYSNGALAGNGPATGLSGTWSSAGSNTPNVFGSGGSGLSFTGLTTTGGAAGRASASGGAHSGIALTGAAQTALTQSGTSIFFTVLVRTDRNSVGNENFTFAFGTDTLDTTTGADGGVAAAIASSGNGFGFSMNNFTNSGGNDSTSDFHGYQSVGGTVSRSTSYLDTGTSVQTLLLAGQIDWVATGNDTLSLFNIGDVTATALPTAFATMSADFNQSLFDTISFESRQIGKIDEIRFGTSWSDVGLAVVPEPSAALLGGLGLLALLRRRRA